MFGERTENFLENRQHLIVGELKSSFLRERARLYADRIMRIRSTLSKCVGFIDGTVLRIVRPSNSIAQRAVYNGRTRTHGLNFQALLAPDGLA